MHLHELTERVEETGAFSDKGDGGALTARKDEPMAQFQFRGSADRDELEIDIRILIGEVSRGCVLEK
jgi:hypothetical protein